MPPPSLCCKRWSSLLVTSVPVTGSENIGFEIVLCSFVEMVSLSIPGLPPTQQPCLSLPHASIVGVGCHSQLGRALVQPFVHFFIFFFSTICSVWANTHQID